MNRLTLHTLMGALLLSVASLSAIAQESSQDSALREEIRLLAQRKSDERDRLSRVSDTGAVDDTPQKDEVSIIAEKDKSVAKIALSRDLHLGRLTAALSTPINKKDDATQFFTLEGPAEDLQLDVAWKKKSFSLRRLSGIDFPELSARRLQICEEFKVPKDKPCSDTELENTMRAAGQSASDIAQVLQDFSSVRIVDRNGIVSLQSLLEAIPYQDFLLGGSVGRTERKFFDLPGAKHEDDRFSYSLNATYRRVFESSRISASLGTQRKFKEAEKARKCTVAGGSTLERCKELPLGEATTVDSVPLAVEYRFWRGRFAVSPKLAYDFEKKVTAASLPIFFITDSEGKLTGGIRLDWEEHKHPVAFIFVSSALGLD